jgi:hypothetical protein
MSSPACSAVIVDGTSQGSPDVLFAATSPTFVFAGIGNTDGQIIATSI